MRPRTLMILLLAACLGAPAAFAHAFLVRSSPAVGATMRHDPTHLVLTFTEALEPVFCTVTVVDEMGMHAEIGRPRAVPGRPRELLVRLKVPMPGRYTVTWHALSVDTHRTQGRFAFTVAPR